MNVIGAVSTESQSAAVPQPRLVQAAHEFEAQLMKELLSPMTNGVSPDGEDPGPGGALADFATEALGQALSKHGGLGIATNILHSLSRDEKKSPSFSNAGTNEKVRPNAGAAGLKSSSRLPITSLRRIAHGNPK
jgi:Rod binding domain-containing protein